jgi:predicted secreted Zn-dependent protease
LRLTVFSSFVGVIFLLSACAPSVTRVVLNQEPTQEVLFPVRGESLKDVGAGVHGHIHGGYAGYANWNTQYTIEVHESFLGKCTAKKISVNFQSKITLPEWRSSGAFDANVLPRWNQFIAALKVHEQGHVEIALSEAKILVAELEALSPLRADNCYQLDDVIRQKFDAAVKSGAEASERYDVLTKHGQLQGAVAQWYD